MKPHDDFAASVSSWPHWMKVSTLSYSVSMYSFSYLLHTVLWLYCVTMAQSLFIIKTCRLLSSCLYSKQNKTKKFLIRTTCVQRVHFNLLQMSTTQLNRPSGFTAQWTFHWWNVALTKWSQYQWYQLDDILVRTPLDESKWEFMDQ